MKQIHTMLLLVGFSCALWGGCAEEEGFRVVNGCTIKPQTVCQGASLAGVSLVGEEMGGADLTGAVLQGSDLTFIDLSGAILKNTNFAQANLTGANLSGANFFGANLVDANFTGAEVEGVDWTSATCPDSTSGNQPNGCVGHLNR